MKSKYYLKQSILNRRKRFTLFIRTTKEKIIIRKIDIGIRSTEKERKKKQSSKKFINSQKGSMHKFLKRNNITEENKPIQETSGIHLQNDEFLEYIDNNNVSIITLNTK